MTINSLLLNLLSFIYTMYSPTSPSVTPGVAPVTPGDSGRKKPALSVSFPSEMTAIVSLIIGIMDEDTSHLDKQTVGMNRVPL
jgi:hypothetical protein